MTQNKTTKRAVLTSALSLLLCCTMLIGTTWAWFTDSVTSAGNIIKSGTLNIDLGIKTKDDNDYVSVKDDPNKKAFYYDKWEPGYTEWVNAKVYTTGNLALKYTMKIVANGVASKLAEVIDVYYVPSEVAKPNDRDLSGLTKLGTLDKAISGEIVINDTLIPGTNEADFATLALHMQETAGNEYQNLSIGTDFSIQILATQLTYEEDTFDENYDAHATYSGLLTVVGDNHDTNFISPDAPVDGKTTTVSITGLPDEYAKGDELDPKADATTLEQAIANTTFTVADGETAIAGLDLALNDFANNKVTFTEATVTTYIVPGLDPANLSVKYNGEGTDGTIVSYDPATGELVFTTTHFSQFYVAYDGYFAYVKQLNRAFTGESASEAAEAAEEGVYEYAESCVDDLEKIDIERLSVDFGNGSFSGNPVDPDYAYFMIFYLGSTYGSSYLNRDLLPYLEDGVTEEQALAMQNQYNAAFKSCSIRIFPLLPDGGFYASAYGMYWSPSSNPFGGDLF